nr:aminotransferase class I/II-fold pyridoxal phosphate-dependent enzyme [Fulvivirga sp. M361]
MINPADRLQSTSEYYFSTKLRELARLNARGKDIINLGIGSPDLPAHPEVVTELSHWAEKPSSHGYQSYVGIPEFREAIASFSKRIYGIEQNPSTEILPLMGSKEGIMHISLAFLNPGDKVLLPDPGYPTYAAVTRLAQAEAVTYALDESNGWLLDMDYLEKLPLPDIKLMWLNYPNMPTGAKGSPQQLERLIALAHEHEFLIVNDNPYGLLFDGQATSIMQLEGARDVCLELNSMSKSHNMAGWRIGWLTGASHYIQAILKVKSNMDSGMFLPVQKAAVKALKLGQDWFDQLNTIYAQRRTIAFEIVQCLGCTYQKEQGGMFVWSKVPEHIDSVEHWIDELIQEAHVFITPGFIFGRNGERFVRISLCSDAIILKEALARIKKYLGKV